MLNCLLCFKIIPVLLVLYQRVSKDVQVVSCWNNRFLFSLTSCHQPVVRCSDVGLILGNIFEMASLEWLFNHLRISIIYALHLRQFCDNYALLALLASNGCRLLLVLLLEFIQKFPLGRIVVPSLVLRRPL